MDDLDFERLSEYLKALANPNRLELLYQLRFPRISSEIRLTPKRRETTGTNPDRNISRQAVERHLMELAAIGLVRPIPATREGRAVEEFVVDNPNLFAVVEEMRRLTNIRSELALDPLATQRFEGRNTPVLESRAAADLPRGPHFLLVNGVGDGRRFPLLAGRSRWLIGRADSVDVKLDYDPFVSHENTEIRRDDKGFVVADLAKARNRAVLNYREIPAGSTSRIEHGDLLGVGRSILLFRER
ncbi:MAG: FHA domain-containing protein [Thermoplasmatota archaeon]